MSIRRKSSRFNPLNYRLTSVDKYQLDENDPLIKRLETVVVRLEGLVSIDSVSGPTPGMKSFQKLIDKELATYVELSRSVGVDVKKQSLVVKEAFEEAHRILTMSSQYAQPKKEDLEKILTPLNLLFQKIQEFVPKDRSKYFFHELTTVSDSVIMIAWFNIFDPVSFTEEVLLGVQTYSNKVVQIALDRKQQKNVEWVRAWLAVLQAVANLVKRYYAGGLRWRPGKTAPYPPLPETAKEDTKMEKIKDAPEKTPKKTFTFKPKAPPQGFNRDDLLSEIASASRKLNLKHVPLSNRLT